MRERKPLATIERAELLAGLFAGNEGCVNPFGDAELAALLAHQMGADIATALREDTSSRRQSAVKIEKALAHLGITTFFELFEQPAPPPAILAEVLRYASQLSDLSPAGFPPEVARVLYALTALCSGGGISEKSPGEAMSDKNLGRWCLAQSWLDDRTRDIVRRRLSRTESESPIPIPR